MNPSDWVSKTPGMGSCFHQALHRWALLRQQGDIYKIAIGVLSPNKHDPNRHIHAWLQRGEEVVSAVTGHTMNRHEFYAFFGIERHTVGLVNPRKIMRARDGVIDRDTVTALLNESGIKWKVIDGGVFPA